MPEETPEITEAPSEPAKSKSPKILIAILLAVVLAGGGFFGMKIMKAGKKGPQKLKVGKIQQLQEFLVNLADQSTFVRADIALGIAEKAEIKAPGEGGKAEGKEGSDDPRVRDAIIMIFSAKKPSDISSIEGKKALKLEIIRKLNEILGERPESTSEPSNSADKDTDSPEKNSGDSKPEENKGPILEVYFTSFATQRY